MTSMEVNHLDVMVEVQTLCDAYNTALLTNDVAALVGFFWDDECAMRLGVAEELYGASEINAFRQARVVNFSDRKNLRESLVTFGDNLAIATVEFSVTVGNTPRHGRQSQVWVRFGDLGWKIVSAHVSHRVTPDHTASCAQSAATAYVPAAAALLGLPIDAAHAPGVLRDLSVMEQLFAPLMALDISTTEAAPVFVA